MNIRNVVNKFFLRKVVDRIYRAMYVLHILPKIFLLKDGSKRIFIFGVPVHPNLGDLAQTMCWEAWFKENYSDYQIIKFNHMTSFVSALDVLYGKITEDDLIFFHSGYHLVDHHPELDVYCRVASKFKENKIIVLPQTINLIAEDKKQSVVAAFSAHADLTLICRDDVSHQMARKIFVRNKLLLYPDVVTTLIGKRRYSNNRNGILFLVRDDIEAFYSKAEIQDLADRLSAKRDTRMLDTTVRAYLQDIIHSRDTLIEKFLQETFASCELVITDRYHGTIFSLITNTPVVVLSSADHKLSSGVKWFPESFSAFVRFADDLDAACDLAEELINAERPSRVGPLGAAQNYEELANRI